MARPLRIEYPGAWYHVMNRGRRGERVFLSPKDYTAFIAVLQEASDNWNLKIAAFCLMSNHYHLLVHTPDGNLSRCMRHINGVYTQRFNRNHKVDGQLFRGRYKAVLIEADSHLLEVLRYIHRNPLRAGVVKVLDDFDWSSHSGYVSHAKRYRWLHKKALLSMLSDKKSRQKSAYLDFVVQEEPHKIEQFYSLTKLELILGSESFKEWVKDGFESLCFNKEIPESKKLAPTPEKIIGVVCDYYKCEKEVVGFSRRGVENLVRDTAIYLVRYYSQETLSEIGQHFNINNYSTVSSAIERIKQRRNRDRKLRKDLKKIGKKLKKS